MGMRTERDVLIDQNWRWFTHSDWSIDRFALSSAWLRCPAAGLVDLGDPQDVGEYQRQRRAWGMRVGRIFSEAQPFRSNGNGSGLTACPRSTSTVRVGLLAMAGCFDVRLPEFIVGAEVTATPARLGVVMQEIGHFVSAATPAHDEKYDRNEKSPRRSTACSPRGWTCSRPWRMSSTA